jgi:uncharacterized protein
MSEDTHNKNKDEEINKNSNWIPEPSPSYKITSTSGSNNADGELDHKEQVNPSPLVDKSAESTFMPPSPAPIRQSEERTWAMLAHFSVLLNLVTGFLGGIAAIIIYFVYKDRSRLVAYHAMQSFIFQTITWLGSGVLAGLFIGLGSAFAIFIIPLLCLIPGFLFLLFIPASLIYGIIGGVKVNNGEDFRYWQVGDWVRDILEPKPVPRQ